jgi:molecular chaperone GrpE
MTEPGQNGQPEPLQSPEAAEPTAGALLDLLRQERADFRNYQRRVTDERAADAERARGQVLEPLFPLLDDLGRAFADVPAGLVDDPWARGIAMLRSRLERTLAGLGLEPVGTVGETFDPALHEAVFHEPDPEGREQRVAQVIRPGYRVGERLLRPAEVVVRGPLGTRAGEPEPDPSNTSDGVRRPEPVTTGRPDDDQRAGG